MSLVINSVYEKLVPVLSAEKYKSLKESIQTHGLWMPIIINQKNIVLDGHHRYKICSELGISVKTVIRNFSNDTDEAIFVGECNLTRRHLTTLQKINLVKHLEPYYEIKIKENMSKGGKGVNDFTPLERKNKILGEKANVSHVTYEKGIRILESATQEDIDEINAGTKSINSVYDKITENEKNHFKQNLQRPYSISLPISLIRGIQYYKRTVPNHNLDQHVEDFIATIVPSIAEYP